MKQSKELTKILNMLNKKLSVIIVNYKSANFLEKCINSVFEKIKNEIPFEIIVVNNDSERIEDKWRNNPQIKIIDNEKNVGFGAGNNIAAKSAQGDILFFLNPDTEIIALEINVIMSLFDNKDLGILGGCLYSKNDKIQPWGAGYEPSLLSLIRNNLVFSVSNKFLTQKDPINVDWVSAAAFFIRRNIFEKLSGFDENFFMYFEDVDLCQRVRLAGKKVLYYPKAIIRHYGGESYQNKKAQKRDYYVSQKYYFRKHRNFFESGIIKILTKLFYNV